MTTSKFKISNKVLSVLLCLAMLLSYVPLSSLTAFAADTETKVLYIGELDLYNQYTTDGTTAVDGAPADDTFSYAYWDYETKTLTLKNYTQTITAKEYAGNTYSGIYYENDINLVLIGENTITVNTSSSAQNANTSGIESGDSLTVTGTGSLDISSPVLALNSLHNITLNCDGSISIKTTSYESGIRAGEKVDIQKGTINISSYYSAISASQLSIANANVTASADRKAVISVYYDVAIKDSTVKAIHNKPNFQTAYNGIESSEGSITIEKSKIEASGSKGGTGWAGSAIEAEVGISISESTVTASAGTSLRFNGSSCTITNSTVNLTSTSTVNSARGIYGNGVSIINSTVAVTSAKAAFNNVPTVNANENIIYYGTDEIAATEQGAKSAADLSSAYSQKYVRIEPYNHTHIWSYSSNGDTITATCTADDCLNKNGGSVTIIKPTDLTYNGNSKDATLSYNNWQPENPTITYNGTSRVNVTGDDITASITLGTATAKVNYLITPVTITEGMITVNPTSTEFNGTAITPSVVVKNSDAPLVKDTDYELSGGVSGTDVDTYTITVKGKGNYAGTVDVKWDITAKNMTGISADDVTVNYDGKEHSIEVKGAPEGATITYSTDGSTYSQSNPTFKDVADSGTVYYKVSLANYNEFNGTATVSINPKEIGISWGGVNFLSYTGQLVLPEVNATGLAEGDTCEVIVSVVETVDGAGVNPGQWTAKITGLSNGNYKLLDNFSPLEVEYTIYASQSAPTVAGVAETVKGKNDGYISGLTTEMEYATEPTNLNSAYTKITDPNKIFAPGTYYVRYAAKDYYYSSQYTEVTVAEGRELTVTLPSANEQNGYAIEADKATLPYEASVSITIKSKEGYSRTEGFTVYNNGVDVTSNFNSATNTLMLANVTEDVKITIADGSFVDTSNPTAEIEIENNKWTSFWNKLTFGLFFKKTQDVTITANDVGSGVKSVQYYLSDRELERDEVSAITDWQTYNGTFKINPDSKYVIYVKVADNSGNTVYLNSDGIVLDATEPELKGIENNGIYYGDQVFKALDDNFLKIEVDSIDITDTTEGDDEFKIVADNAEHTVTVTDKAGNVTEYKITVYKNYTVTFKADGVTVDTQTVGYGKDATVPTIPTKDGYTQTAPTWDKDGKNITTDTEINAIYTINKYTVTYKANGEVVDTVTVEHGKDATAPVIPEKEGYTQTAPTWDKDGKNITVDTEINAVYTINKYTVTYKADGEVVDTVTVEHGKDATLPVVPAKDGYVGKWDNNGNNITGDTTVSAVYTAIPAVKPDEVKPDDKTELEDTKNQLEEMLNDESYTEDDKKDIQEAIDNIDDALDVIGNVENVEKLIDKLPDTIKKDDEDAIKAADEAYNALSDYEKSLVDKDAKKALDDAKAALAELNKPADSTSPNTGDNSNLWLWVALLFVSGGATITLTVYDRKKRTAQK